MVSVMKALSLCFPQLQGCPQVVRTEGFGSDIDGDAIAVFGSTTSPIRPEPSMRNAVKVTNPPFLKLASFLARPLVWSMAATSRQRCCLWFPLRRHRRAGRRL